MGLAEKILDKSARIGVVGLGYVGLPLAMAFARRGYHVIGIDVSKKRVDQLNRGTSPIFDVTDDEISQFVSDGRFVAGGDYGLLNKGDAVFICVPTPITPQKAPDVSFIESASRSIAAILRPEQIIILQSTTYPGTTQEIVLPILNQSGLAAGTDYYLAFSPERINPGDRIHTVENTPKVVGGLNARSTELASLLLSQITPQVHCVSSPRVAEMTKLLENTFRSVNIALVNELALLSERMGIDIWEVIAAAGTKPFGFMPFYPGPGVGGHCIGVDPYYLSWKAREFDFFTKFIELAAETNQSMPYHAVSLVSEALGLHGIGLAGARVLVIGVTFKPNVEDIRNSPAERILQLLVERRATVSYHDPYVPQLALEREGAPPLRLTAEPLTEAVLAASQCVVIATAHHHCDYDRIVHHAPLVVDTVNATAKLAPETIANANGKITRLGAVRRNSIRSAGESALH